MRHLSIASYSLTAIGVLLVLVASFMSLDTSVLLAGVLLAWAGLIKIAVVLVWTRVAGMDSNNNEPIRDQ